MKEIIKLFKENGYQLWNVGGAVRDELLGKESNDIDFATDATPDEMVGIFDNYRHYGNQEINIWWSDNGRAHGTIVLREDGVNYEITTFRKDVATDGRNATIEFAKTIEEDLSRRDFTMNAIAKCAYTGKMVDPFNGQEDIKNRIIRFVGDATTRIQEDRLRILRGFRFLSQLGKGWKFIDDKAISLLSIKELDLLSGERIRDEITKMFMYNPCMAFYNMPAKILNYLFGGSFYGAFDYHGSFHGENIRQHMFIALAASTRLTKNPLLRMACFLHDIGKNIETEDDENGYPTFVCHEIAGADYVEKWMQGLRFSKIDIHYVTQLIRNHMVSFTLFKDGVSNRSVKRYIMRLDEELLDDMCLLNYCDRTANLAHTDLCSYEEYLVKHTIKPIWLKIKEEENCFKVTDLAVNGHDMIELGLQGKLIGSMLQNLFELVEEETLKNDREVLLEKAKELK